jgi:hypothetical protein
MKLFVLPQYLVEPQYIEGYVEESQTAICSKPLEGLADFLGPVSCR